MQIRNSPNPYILLIGPAGSGKTTLSKRVVLSTLQKGNYSFFVPLSFVNPQKPIDLKYLLFELQVLYFSNDMKFSKSQLNAAFAWFLANQHKVTIILEGLDQARFSLRNCQVPTEISVHKKYLASELLYLILSRKLLPKVRLILTSRPHSILNFEVNIQTNYVLYLDDLSENDMKKLFCFFLKTGDSDKILKKLREKSPNVQKLFFCPLYLRLFCHLHQIVGDEIWRLVGSVASLFEELINRLHCSAHKASPLEEIELMTKLSKLAYGKTATRSVVITQEDLLGGGVTPNEVQDFMVGLNGPVLKALLVGTSLFYFAHQSIQVKDIFFYLVYYYIYFLNKKKLKFFP